MFFTPIKFYDADQNDGTGGGSDAAAAAQGNDGKVDIVPAPIFTPEELTQYGFKTVDEAKAAAVAAWTKQKESSVTEEEKQRLANIENAEMLKFAAEENLIDDNFKNYDSLKGKTDRDLVYNKFATEFKEDNPDIPADKLEEETKAAFEVEYKLASTNEKEKARGESRLSKEAKEMRTPAEAAYEKVKTGFQQRKEILQKGAEYAKTFKEVVGAVPDKLKVFETKIKKDDNDEGEDLAIEVELTKEEKAEVEKQFNTEKTLRAFLQAEKDGKLEDFKKNLSKKIIASIKSSREEKIYSDIVDKVKGIAIRYGSDTGAGQPFAIVKNISEAGGITKTAQQEILDSHNKVAQKHAL